MDAIDIYKAPKEAIKEMERLQFPTITTNEIERPSEEMEKRKRRR